MSKKHEDLEKSVEVKKAKVSESAEPQNEMSENLEWQQAQKDLEKLQAGKK